MFGMSLQNLQGWAPVLSVIFNAVMVLVCWSLRNIAKDEFAKLIAPTRATVVEHDRQLVRHQENIEEIRADINQLPTKADIERLGGKIDGVGQLVTRAEAAVERVESYFLEEGVKRRRSSSRGRSGANS